MTSNCEKDKAYAEEMRKAQAGDNVAYGALLKKISPLISGFIYNKIGKGADNDDILQEVLMAIHRSAHTYNTDRSFRNWMFAIANYKIKDYLRSYYRKKSLIQVDFEEVKDFISDDVTNAPSQSELLSELLNDLPQRQRKILYLMKIEGYSIKEVASLMKMNISAVKVAAHRTYKTLINNQKERDSNE